MILRPPHFEKGESRSNAAEKNSKGDLQTPKVFLLIYPIFWNAIFVVLRLAFNVLN
jgi:hypothetical protein